MGRSKYTIVCIPKLELGNEEKAFFDTSGDGMKTLTGWISGEDGLTPSFIKPMKYINNSLYKANLKEVA